MQEHYIKNVWRINDEHLKVRHIQTIDNVMEINIDFTHQRFEETFNVFLSS